MSQQSSPTNNRAAHSVPRCRRNELPPNFECEVEACRQVPGALVEVLNFNWRCEQEVVLEVVKPYLDLALSPRVPATNHYVEAGASTDNRPGEMIFLPAGYHLHSHLKVGQQRCVSCEFDPTQLDPGLQVDWGRYELQASLDVRNVFIREAMLRLARELLAPGFSSDILVESLCSVLAIELPRHFGLLRWREFGGNNKLEPEHLKRVQERILARDTPLPTVAELAAECHMSARHFSRLFRQTTGQTVGDFISQERIAYAKNALGMRSATIKQVSFQCGFKSISAFSVAFRRETGLSPGQYRTAVALKGALIDDGDTAGY